MTVAFIPVRGGSRSIPGKNIRQLAGRPLVHYTIEAALGCSRIDRVYVSSDSEEILRVARQLDGPRLHCVRRAAELATDTASTESALIDFAERHDFDRVVLLQATSPLTTSQDISAALARMDETHADSLVSVTRERRFLWKPAEGGYATPKNYVPARRPRRQDWDGELVENGALYVSDRAALLESGCRLSGNIALLEMAPETAVELDDERDWSMMEVLISGRFPSVVVERAKRIRCVVTDVDGVLTDGGMFYGPDGEMLKKFNTRDGQGFALLGEAGVAVAIVTREESAAVAARARKLGIEEMHLGVRDKLPRVKEIAGRLGLDLTEVAYIGDDVHDVETMRHVGLAACPRDAQPPARAAALFHCTRDGGTGCVREFGDFLLSVLDQ